MQSKLKLKNARNIKILSFERCCEPKHNHQEVACKREDSTGWMEVLHFKPNLTLPKCIGKDNTTYGYSLGLCQDNLYLKLIVKNVKGFDMYVGIPV